MGDGKGMEMGRSVALATQHTGREKTELRKTGREMTKKCCCMGSNIMTEARRGKSMSR